MKNSTENTVRFVGNGKTYGKKIQISMDWELVKKSPKVEFNGKKYLIVDAIEMQAPDQYKRTHTVIDHTPYKKKDS